MVINFKKLNDKARVPTRAYEHAAGWDLYATESVVLTPCQRCAVSTGLSLEIPQGYYARIAPRSGLAVKYGIDVLAGIIDSDYRGDIKVVLVNINPVATFYCGALSEEKNADVILKPGDKIAQLIIAKCEDVEWVEQQELTDTLRGEKGFGSSCVKS